MNIVCDDFLNTYFQEYFKIIEDNIYHLNDFLNVSLKITKKYEQIGQLKLRDSVYLEDWQLYYDLKTNLEIRLWELNI